MVIRRMVEQFALPVNIVAGDTARADDGLALSSRNGYLSDDERQQAMALSLALKQLADAARAGQAPLAELEAWAMQSLAAQGWEPDYLTVRLRSEEHTSELQSQSNLVCRLLLEKKKKQRSTDPPPGA